MIIVIYTMTARSTRYHHVRATSSAHAATLVKALHNAQILPALVREQAI